MDNKKTPQKILLFLFVSFTCIFAASFDKESGVRIISTSGTVTITEKGRHSSSVIQAPMKIHGSDLLKTGSRSAAQLKYENGITVTVKENSEILLDYNLSQKNHVPLQIALVLFGNVFIQIPEKLFNGYTDILHTPAAKISAQKGDFGVIVDPNTGYTEIDVIHGKVLAGNMLLNTGYYIPSGNKATVSIHEEPTAPIPLTAVDLQNWGIAGLPMKTPIPAVKSTDSLPNFTGNNAIIVTKFLDNSGYIGNWNITEGIGKMVANELKGINSFPVIYLNDNEMDADQLGKKANARFVITGEIKEFNLERQTEAKTANQFNEFFKASVELVLFIVDPAKNSLVNTIHIQEAVRGDDLSGNNWNVIDKISFDKNDPSFKNTALGQAVINAIKKTVQDASNYLVE